MLQINEVGEDEVAVCYIIPVASSRKCLKAIALDLINVTSWQHVICRPLAKFKWATTRRVAHTAVLLSILLSFQAHSLYLPGLLAQVLSFEPLSDHGCGTGPLPLQVKILPTVEGCPHVTRGGHGRGCAVARMSWRVVLSASHCLGRQKATEKGLSICDLRVSHSLLFPSQLLASARVIDVIFQSVMKWNLWKTHDYASFPQKTFEHGTISSHALKTVENMEGCKQVYISIYGWQPLWCLHFWPLNPFTTRVSPPPKKGHFFPKCLAKKIGSFWPWKFREHALPPSLQACFFRIALKPLVLQCFDAKSESNTGNVNTVFNVFPHVVKSA